jgi:hypothetical protein
MKRVEILRFVLVLTLCYSMAARAQNESSILAGHRGTPSQGTGLEAYCDYPKSGFLSSPVKKRFWLPCGQDQSRAGYQNRWTPQFMESSTLNKQRLG